VVLTVLPAVKKSRLQLFQRAYLLKQLRSLSKVKIFVVNDINIGVETY
jgi:hypothetical protein